MEKKKTLTIGEKVAKFAENVNPSIIGGRVFATTILAGTLSFGVATDNFIKTEKEVDTVERVMVSAMAATFGGLFGCGVGGILGECAEAGTEKLNRVMRNRREEREEHEEVERLIKLNNEK